jgi:FtsP/CotA-like multicopper oxidase with cupredoxin domain
MLASPYRADTLLIAPGERYDVLVEPRGEIGSTVPLQNLYYDRGHELPDPGPKPILRLRFDKLWERGAVADELGQLHADRHQHDDRRAQIGDDREDG